MNSDEEAVGSKRASLGPGSRRGGRSGGYDPPSSLLASSGGPAPTERDQNFVAGVRQHLPSPFPFHGPESTRRRTAFPIRPDRVLHRWRGASSPALDLYSCGASSGRRFHSSVPRVRSYLA